MTRVIAGASGALSASTGIREVASTLCTGVEEGLESCRKGDVGLWTWNEPKSQEFARTDQYCPRTWMVAPLCFPSTPSFRLFHASLASLSLKIPVHPPLRPFLRFIIFLLPFAPSFLDLASRASFSSSLIRFPSSYFPSFDGFVYPASPLLLPTLVRR